MIEEREKIKEIGRELGINFKNREENIFSKFKGKIERLGKIFLATTLIGIGGELMAQEVNKKIQKDVRLITTPEVLGNFLKSGVGVEKGAFIFPNQPWKGEKHKPLLFFPDFALAAGEVGGIKTDSMKITESEKNFAIISFSSDGSKDSAVVNKDGEVENIITINKDGKTIQELGEKEIQAMWESEGE